MSGGIPFGNYQLLRRIARGGMAEVFLASQRGPEGFERTVAIKRILPHLADSPEFVQMFMDEARLAARLSHPNVAHIYEFGKVEDSYFIAMEYIDGIDLAPIILAGERALLPLAHAARIAADVAAGLNYAHQQKGPDGRPLGIVHRDISPQNILVSFDGAVKVVDFGIAKAAHVMERTKPGVIRGKYTYMSPEQVRGQKLDGRTDVFCLGIVLCELATGQTLFSRIDAMAAMTEIRDGAPPKPRRGGKPLGGRLEQIIHKALARDPDQRYPDAASLQLELEQFLHSTSEISNSLVLAEYFREHYRKLRPEAVASAGTQAVAPGTQAVAPGTQAVAPGTPAVAPGSMQIDDQRPVGNPGTLQVAGAFDASVRQAQGEHQTLIRFRSTERPSSDPVELDPSDLELADEEDRDTDLSAVRTRVEAPRRGAKALEDPRDHQLTRVELDRLTPRSAGEPHGSDARERSADELRTRVVIGSGFVAGSGPLAGSAPVSGAPSGAPASGAPAANPAGSAQTGPFSPWEPHLPSGETATVALAPSSTQLVAAIDGARRGRRRKLGLLIGALVLVPLSGVVGYFLAAPGRDDALTSVRDGSRSALAPDAGRPARPPRDAAPAFSPRSAGGARDAAGADAVPRDAAPRQRDAGTRSDLRATQRDASTRPSPAEAQGTLHVDSRPRGARVQIDGELAGTTPATWRGTAGARVVVVALPGYHPRRRMARVRRGRTTTLRLRLRRRRRPQPGSGSAAPRAAEPGYVSVTTTPWSRVYFGARLLGMSPFANVSVPAGRHTLRFVNPQVGTVTRAVRIRPGRVTKLNFSLRY